MKKLALEFLVCFVVITVASIVSVLSKYYTDWFIYSPFFFAGMIYEWYLIKKSGLYL